VKPESGNESAAAVAAGRRLSSGASSRRPVMRTRDAVGRARVEIANEGETSVRDENDNARISLDKSGLAQRDSDNVERLTTRDTMSATETAAAGRRLQTGVPVTRRPIIRTRDSAGRSRAEIGETGELSVRDENDKERFKASRDGLAVRDADDVERFEVKPESGNESAAAVAAGRRLSSGASSRRPVMRTRDAVGRARVEIANEGETSVRDENDNTRMAMDTTGLTVNDDGGVPTTKLSVRHRRTAAADSSSSGRRLSAEDEGRRLSTRPSAPPPPGRPATIDSNTSNATVYVPQPVFQIFDEDGHDETDFTEDGTMVMRDQAGVVRVSAGTNGLSLSDETGMERATLKNDGNETLSTKDAQGVERFRISRFGDLQSKDEQGHARFAVDKRGSLELRDETGNQNLLVDEFGMGVQNNRGEDVMGFTRDSGTLVSHHVGSNASIHYQADRPADYVTPGATIPIEQCFAGSYHPCSCTAAVPLPTCNPLHPNLPCNAYHDRTSLGCNCDNFNPPSFCSTSHPCYNGACTCGASGATGNTCPWNNDGYCDDGGPGSQYAFCALGTDCSDCGLGTRACDSCSYSNDGDCDDGGSGSEFSMCFPGTDCTDCNSWPAPGPATPPSPPAPPAAPPVCCANSGCYYLNDGVCDDGGPNSLYSDCALGHDCADCGDRCVPQPPAAPPTCCENNCGPDTSDGFCDDGGLGAHYTSCGLGNDCTDCGNRCAVPPSPPSLPLPPLAPPTCCTETCSYASDGVCDDGGPGSSYTDCASGTDCTDCGNRCSATPSPPFAPSPAGVQPAAWCVDACVDSSGIDWSRDGYCGDSATGSGGVNAVYNDCGLGSDCSDCGPRYTCVNTCSYAGDGYCDDGGPGAYTGCILGTDCTDCGDRASLG